MAKNKNYFETPHVIHVYVFMNLFIAWLFGV